MGARRGIVKEVLGAVTGDRRVEAEGVAEQEHPDPTEPEVEEAEHTVRERHGDIRADDADDA